MYELFSEIFRTFENFTASKAALLKITDRVDILGYTEGG